MRRPASRIRRKISKLMSLRVRSARSMSSTKQIRLNLSDQSPNSANSTEGAGMASTWSCALAARDHEVAHFVEVAFVSDVDRDDDASDAIVVDPVLDDAADEVRVGHDQAAAVEGLDLGRAGVDRANEPLIRSHHHPVADADGALPQQDEAGDEIVGDRLQAEADADRQARRRSGRFSEGRGRFARRP